MYIVSLIMFTGQSSISDDVKISEHPSTQLQQKDISQHDFLSNQSESTFQSSKPEPNFLSHRQEPDFLSSKPESETRTTDFFNFSMADKQRQKEARLQSSPEVKIREKKINVTERRIIHKYKLFLDWRVS